jgi:hypothetical protein
LNPHLKFNVFVAASNVQLPTEDRDFTAVSMYVDDKGRARGFPMNERATQLLRACGYDTQTVHGDCFIGR